MLLVKAAPIVFRRKSRAFAFVACQSRTSFGLSCLHITAIGSDTEHKNEIHPEVLARVDRFVCDRRTQSLRLGEWHHALAADLLSETAAVDELGEIGAGQDEVTLCDLTGTGVQDTAIACHAFRVATENGLGLTIET